MEEKEKAAVENRREFSDPISGKTYYIAAPTANDVREADWQYSKIYTKSLMEGIVTSAEMMDVLKIRGVIGPEFERRQKELTDELAIKVEALRNTGDLDEKQQAALDVSQNRQELYDWNYRLNGPMGNTCEQMADDSRLEHLTSRMIQNVNGEKLWDEYSDFLTEKNQALSMRARFEVMLYLQGLESDFLDKTPEAMAIREIEQEIQTKASEAMAELEAAVAEKEAKDKPEDPEEKATKDVKTTKTVTKTTTKKKPGRPPKKKEAE